MCLTNFTDIDTSACMYGSTVQTAKLELEGNRPLRPCLSATGGHTNHTAVLVL